MRMNKNTRLAQYEKAKTGDVMGTLGLKCTIIVGLRTWIYVVLLFRLESLQILFIILAVVMGALSIMFLIFGILATGATRQNLYAGAKCIMGGRVSALFVSLI